MQVKHEKSYPEDTRKLRDYMFQLRHCDYLEVRKAIIEGCLVPTYTYSNWLHGRCRIPALAKQKINEIIGKEIF